MVTTENAKRIAKKLVDIVSAAGIPIYKAYLFGSAACGRNHEYSDIDVALVSDKFTGVLFDDRKALNPFVIRIDSSLELHPFTVIDFSPDNPFANEIMKSGVLVC